MKSKKTIAKPKCKSNSNVLSHKHVNKITQSNSKVKKEIPKRTKSSSMDNDTKKDNTHKHNTKELSHEDDISITSSKTALIALNKPIIQTKLLTLANISDDLEEMLKHYKTKIKNVIEVPKLEINKKKVCGQVVTRSFRIYDTVLKDFLKFAEKHDQFTNQDLLSQAVVEFIEHYHN